MRVGGAGRQGVGHAPSVACSPRQSRRADASPLTHAMQSVADDFLPRPCLPLLLPFHSVSHPLSCPPTHPPSLPFLQPTAPGQSRSWQASTGAKWCGSWPYMFSHSDWRCRGCPGRVLACARWFAPGARDGAACTGGWRGNLASIAQPSLWPQLSCAPSNPPLPLIRHPAAAHHRPAARHPDQHWALQPRAARRRPGLPCQV